MKEKPNLLRKGEIIKAHSLTVICDQSIDCTGSLLQPNPFWADMKFYASITKQNFELLSFNFCPAYFFVVVAVTPPTLCRYSFVLLITCPILDPDLIFACFSKTQYIDITPLPARLLESRNQLCDLFGKIPGGKWKSIQYMRLQGITQVHEFIRFIWRKSCGLVV